MTMKIVKEHDEVRTFTELSHYEAHPERKESSAFKKLKDQLHKEGAKCFINNGKCEGGIEIHHNIIEFSASEGIDWKKVQKDYPNFTNVDSFMGNMLPLCQKHHREPGFGIHYVTYPIWILQKYMDKEALDDFERAVDVQLKRDEK